MIEVSMTVELSGMDLAQNLTEFCIRGILKLGI